MRIISHRGNLDGPIPEKENKLTYIDEAIEAGFDVEIDLRFKDGDCFLGHDEPQYQANLYWLFDRKNQLWAHCKDIESFTHTSLLRRFCHSSDPFVAVTYTLSSTHAAWVWVHDLSLELNNYCIIPLMSKKDIDNFDLTRKVYGICTDYPIYLGEKLNEQK